MAEQCGDTGPPSEKHAKRFRRAAATADRPEESSIRAGSRNVLGLPSYETWRYAKWEPVQGSENFTVTPADITFNDGDYWSSWERETGTQALSTRSMLEKPMWRNYERPSASIINQAG